MTARKPWTPQENAAVVRLYFAMLDAVIAGMPYNKAAMIRAAQQGLAVRDLCPSVIPAPYVNKLAERSRGSIEAKLMNCSAAHRDISAKSGGKAITMDGFGYRALSNYQASLRDAMQAEMIRREYRQGDAA